MTSHDTDHICELVIQILAKSNQLKPPVDLPLVAESLGIEIILSDLTPDVTVLTDAEDRTIILNENQPEEVRTYGIAHGIAEFLCVDDFDDSARREWISLMATELLLPADWFRPIGFIYNWNLINLKCLFPNVSYELLARRIIDFHPSLVTIVSDGRILSRQAFQGIRFPTELIPEEGAAYRNTHVSRRPDEVSGRNCRVRAWPIDGYSDRCILLTEVFPTAASK